MDSGSSSGHGRSRIILNTGDAEQPPERVAVHIPNKQG